MAELTKFGAAFEALRECACAIQSGDLSPADYFMEIALDLAAEDDNESRIVRYFAQALARRAYRLLPKYPPDFSNCYHDGNVFYSCRAAKLIQQDAIGKADLSGKSKIHLIFFSPNCFTQETLIFMKKLLEKVPQMCLKITLVETSNNSSTTIDAFVIQLAEGIKFEINRVGVINQRLDELDVSRLKIDEDDEFVVVNCFFLLGYIMPVALNKFLLMLRDYISPDMFILAEYDANLNQSEFLPRFDESLQYYSNLYSYLGKTYGSFFIQFLQNEISNVVAYEGGARVVRHMTSDQWRDLLNKSGFSSVPLLNDNESRLIDSYTYFEIENGCLKINGKGQERPLFFISAWEIKESSFGEDIYHNSLDGDHNFQNLPISPDPQHRSLIRMASLVEIHDMTYQKLKGYHVQEILVWGKCEDNHNDGRSSQLNPCLCIVDQIGSIYRTQIPEYHLQERNYVTKTFESNQPCFVPDRTYEEKGLSIYCADYSVSGAFAIKLNSLHANCEGYVVVFLFNFPYNMASEKRKRVKDKILCNLRSEKSYFVTCSTPDDFLDKFEATPDAVRIIDNPSVQSQSHNNVMDMNVPWLQLLHGSSTPNAMPASHQNDLLDSSIAELLNLNEVSSTPSAKPARDQSLLALPTTDIDTKEGQGQVKLKQVSIKRKRKIEPPAPSTSKKNKSLIWDHVKKVEGEAGNFWVICNRCGFKRKHNSKQGTTVWKNHLERHHDVKFKNVQESPQLTGVENGTTIEKFKDANCGPSVPTDADQTTELVDQRSSPWSPRNETQEISTSGAKCMEVSPAHEETKTTFVKGTNWSLDKQTGHENSKGTNGFHREDDSRQGTKVWMNHLERHHNVKFKNVQESSKHPTPPPQMTGVETEIFKDVGFSSRVTWAEDLTEDVQTKKISSRRVVITNDEWIEGSKQWENALVGYVLGPKPTLEEMTSFAKTRWEKFQVPKVSLVDDNDGIFLFDFESIDMKRGVWESQWTYKDHLLVLRQMTPDLDLDTLKVSRKVPIWMELPKLHFSLWNPELLGKLAHVLGTLVDIDMSTKNRKQLTCARILVEVDIDTIDDLPSEIPIDLPLKSIDQPVVFDRKSVRNSFMASKIRLQKAGANEIKRPQPAWLEENVWDYLIFGFTLEEKNLLEQWRKYKAIGKIVTTLGTIDVIDTSLACLVPPQENVVTRLTPGHELHNDDTIIDAYFYLLKKRCDMHPNKYRKHHFFNCFMATQICGKANNLSRWYKLEDLADVCKLFLPVHVQLPPELNHWVLLCVNIEDRQLLWMDSCEGLQNFYEKERDTISEWFVGTLLPDMGYKEANWDVIVRDDIPKQETAYDCGVFVMKYADCLTQGDCFPFSQSDMVCIRERIFLDIFMG